MHYLTLSRLLSASIHTCESCLLLTVHQLSHHRQQIWKTSLGVTADIVDKCHDQKSSYVVVALMEIAFWKQLQETLMMLYCEDQ
jgi:hypothetical protein